MRRTFSRPHLPDIRYSCLLRGGSSAHFVSWTFARQGPCLRSWDQWILRGQSPEVPAVCHGLIVSIDTTLGAGRIVLKGPTECAQNICVEGKGKTIEVQDWRVAGESIKADVDDAFTLSKQANPIIGGLAVLIAWWVLATAET
jgi:hypothetical protein